MYVIPRPANPAESNKGPEQARTKSQTKSTRRRQKKKEKQRQAGDDGHDTSVRDTPNKPAVPKKVSGVTDKPTSTNKSTGAGDKGDGGGQSSDSERQPKRNATQSPDVLTDCDAVPKTENHAITENNPFISDESVVKDEPDAEKKHATESGSVIENVPNAEDGSASEYESDPHLGSTAKKDLAPEFNTCASNGTYSNVLGDTSDTPSDSGQPTTGAAMTKSGVSSSSSSDEDLHTFKKVVRTALTVATRAVVHLWETQEQVVGTQEELANTLEDLAHVIRNELEGTQDRLDRAQEQLTLAQLQVKEAMVLLDGAQSGLADSKEAIWGMEAGLRELCERLVHVLRV
ncbi:hypothetical protein BGZ81_009940 [Podila clonocystis]|nr:hypothetical protein BGZ81_009940 [Podila clonocystis]